MDLVQPTVYQCTLQLRFRTYWSFPCTGWAQHAAEPWHHTPQLTLDGLNVRQFDKSMTLHIIHNRPLFLYTYITVFYPLSLFLFNNSFVWMCSISWMRYMCFKLMYFVNVLKQSELWLSYPWPAIQSETTDVLCGGIQLY